MNKYSRNDIIIAYHPTNPHNLICKRLIGLPGDVVLMNSPKKVKTEEGSSDTETIFIKPGSCWLVIVNVISSKFVVNFHYFCILGR